MQAAESSIIPPIPANMPRIGNRFTRGLGRSLMRLQGWQLKGEFPDEPKLMVALAPHTSNWDFVYAMPVIMALGVKVSFLMKKEAFIWPLGGLFSWWGGIPINRTAAGDMVEQVAEWYDTHDQVWVAITPEGTRKKNEQWKSGFLRIAHRAQVPVFLMAWDYPNKCMHCDKVFMPTGDHSADLEEIKQYFKGRYTGYNVDQQ